MMDPSFAHSMRVYLVGLDREHAPSASDPSVCSCGDPQVDGRDRHLLEVITEHFAEPPLEPHVVHVDPVFETTRIRTYDPDRAGDQAVPGEDVVAASKTAAIDGAGLIAIVDVPEVRTPYWEFDETVRRQDVTECPDCGRHLTSRGEDMICPSLPATTPLRGCHEGCVVSCGVAPAAPPADVALAVGA